jgi:hypothetical protein
MLAYYSMAKNRQQGGEAPDAESVSDKLEAPKAMVLPREKPSPRECLPLVIGTNTDDGTIRMA